MAALPPIPTLDPTLDAVRAAAAVRGNAEAARPYLGMSSIGRSCARQQWYQFRWAGREQFDCDTLWRFEDGHRSEDVMAERLRLVSGIQLRTVDPRTGTQFGFSDIGGHFRGHTDGMITGLLQAPKTLHVWEGKAVNEKKFAQLVKLKAEAGEKMALKLWDPIYYAQAILYMAYSETTRHYLTACTPGGREMVGVRTDLDLDEARRLRAKAERIITASEPPPKISEDPAWYECKWCPFHSICHGSELPAVNVRTCAHATPELDGDARWSCAKCGRDVSEADQRKPCTHHLYIPALVTAATGAEQVDASESENWIEYRLPDGRTFRNGMGGEPINYTSEELRVMDRGLIGNVAADALRALGAHYVDPESFADEQVVTTPVEYRWVQHGTRKLLGRYSCGRHNAWLSPAHPEYKRAVAEADREVKAAWDAISRLNPPRLFERGTERFG